MALWLLLSSKMMNCITISGIHYFNCIVIPFYLEAAYFGLWDFCFFINTTSLSLLFFWELDLILNLLGNDSLSSKLFSISLFYFQGNYIKSFECFILEIIFFLLSLLTLALHNEPSDSLCRYWKNLFCS